MPRKKKIERDREAEADDLLLRALRQLADETLEEAIPERLLRPLRDAQSRERANGERRQGAGDDSSDRRSEAGRRRTGSA